MRSPSQYSLEFLVTELDLIWDLTIALHYNIVHYFPHRQPVLSTRDQTLILEFHEKYILPVWLGKPHSKHHSKLYTSLFPNWKPIHSNSTKLEWKEITVGVFSYLYITARLRVASSAQIYMERLLYWFILLLVIYIWHFQYVQNSNYLYHWSLSDHVVRTY